MQAYIQSYANSWKLLSFSITFVTEWLKIALPRRFSFFIENLITAVKEEHFVFRLEYSILVKFLCS